MLQKIKKQKFEQLKGGRQNCLYETINKFLPNETAETKGIVAGLCIEYVIKSKGNTDVFVDELLVTLPDNDELDNEEKIW